MTKESDCLIEASDVIPMFPTLVWKVQLKRELHTAINAKMLAAIDGMRREDAEPGPRARSGLAVRSKPS